MAKSGLHGVDRTSSSSMLAIPKYKRKEERKKILKMCVKKLRSIDDPETFLCRSVLINNTLKQIQAFHKAKEASKHAHHQMEWEREVMEREDNKEAESEESESPTSSDTEEPYEQSLAEHCEPAHHIPMNNTHNHTNQTHINLDGSLASRNDHNDYNAEDILSDILLPPPLSPRLEDITDCRLDTDFSLSVSSSLLSTNWAHEDALDWVAVNSHNTHKWPGIPASDDLKSTLDVSVINDICEETKTYTDLGLKCTSHSALCDETEAVVPNNKDNVDECFDDSSDNSSDGSGASEDRTSSEGDPTEFEFSSCGRSVNYMADIQTVVLNNLIASLES